jgi:hypothetical protein
MPQFDWASVDDELIRGMDVFTERLASLHPELTEDALDALAWKFSWEWR